MLNFKLKIRNLKFIILPFLVQLFSVLPLAVAAQPPDLEAQARQIAAELRCPVCQNLSAGDSPSELAQQMKGIILEQLKEGKSADEIKAYFVSKYGEWVLLSPPARGFGLLVWVLPYVVAVAGIVLVLLVVRRWTGMFPNMTFCNRRIPKHTIKMNIRRSPINTTNPGRNSLQKFTLFVV